uniref:U18-Theraphotoxin-Sfo1a_1 n=1 Tax=Selenotholus foelschei TaxID=1905327 RepID=A0A482Z807_9ARAC
MKASTLLVIAGIALLAVVCDSLELKEQNSLREMLSAVLQLQEPQERDCKTFGKACKYPGNECCEGLTCSRRDRWCKVYLGK